MAKQLTKEAIDKILKDADLFASVSKILQVAPTSLRKTLERNGNKVNRMESVEAIAKAMGLTPDDIREDVKEFATA